jgi:hypothetical protein
MPAPRRATTTVTAAAARAARAQLEDALDGAAGGRPWRYVRSVSLWLDILIVIEDAGQRSLARRVVST